MKKRILATLLSLCLLIGLLPVTAMAEEDNKATGSCSVTAGYTLDNGHEGDCNAPTEPELSEELKALQERINMLPTGDEYRVMTDEERNTVYENAAAISDDYTVLPEGDQAKLDISKMEALLAVINEGTARLNNTTYTGTLSDPLVLNIDGTCVFNNLEIDRGSTFIANGYAVIIPQGSKVTIQLEGTSTLTAAPGYAAILVEEGAELTISGDGTLNAIRR